MALQGSTKTLEEGGCSLIYVEVFFVAHYKSAPLLYEVWQFLEGYRYSLFDIYNMRRAENGQLSFGDALFVSERIRSDVIDRFDEEL